MENMEKNSDLTQDFSQIITLIESAKRNALKKVNEELIQLYYQMGHFLSDKVKQTTWGDSYIDEVASFITTSHPTLKGFNRRGLYRMKQFYEAYCDDEFVSTLLTQITWSNHLAILAASKTTEERDFYIQLSIKEKYSFRELQRQLDSGYYERFMLSHTTVLPEAVTKTIKNEFLDSYVLEFLDLPDKFSEHDFKKAIIHNLKSFILEIGKDFSFIAEEYRVQVGLDDFYIDLLFYHRGLACLVAFELKIGKFKPEHLGKLNFYLEALDREHKKENENPSVGVILCSTKNSEVVEFALSRSLSPAMISEYTLKLPQKELLQKKLHELKNVIEGDLE